MIAAKVSSNKATQRYAVLEAAIEHFGFLTTPQIAALLGLSKGQAGRVLRAYRRRVLFNIVYTGRGGLRGWKCEKTYYRRFLAEDQEPYKCLLKYGEVHSLDIGEIFK